MSCEMRFVLGNHDSLKLYSENRWNNVLIQLPFFSYKNMWISHCPIAEREIRERDLVIHGHCHNFSMPDKRYYNVILDKNDFKFVEYEQLMKRIEETKCI